MSYNTYIKAFRILKQGLDVLINVIILSLHERKKNKDKIVSVLATSKRIKISKRLFRKKLYDFQ